MMTQGGTLRGLIVGEVSARFSVHQPVEWSMPLIDVFEDGVSEFDVMVWRSHSLKAACENTPTEKGQFLIRTVRLSMFGLLQ